MNEIFTSVLVASLSVLPEPVQVRQTVADSNWCPVGYTVMIADGREGEVMSKSGDICRIVAAGEIYVTLIPYYLVEPVYPQAFRARTYVH
jgi:hypothetical protein